MDRDEELPISVRMAMCPADTAVRERDLSGCRAAGAIPELPILIFVPPLLFQSLIRLHALVTGGWANRVNRIHCYFLDCPRTFRLRPLWLRKKLWILLVQATSLSGRRVFPRCFCSTGGIGAYRRGRLSNGHIPLKLNKTFGFFFTLC